MLSEKQNKWGLLNWRHWHYHVKYFIASPAWVWFTLRSGNIWFFTASNPSLTFGGMEGEGKREMYEQLPEGSYPKTIYIQPGEDFSAVQERISKDFEFPFIVKPEIGMMGFMFRKINNAAQLEAYHTVMTTEYLAQSLVEYDTEVSVMYYRMPGEQRGKITGFITKEPAYVTGDGVRTLKQLILDHTNDKVDKPKTLVKFETELDVVLPNGLKKRLNDASNRNQGGVFQNLAHLIDEDLQRMFDKLSLHAGEFYYGRYDILCKSVDDLKAGKNFSILEFNGAGAGPQHFHTAKTFIEVLGIIVYHWKLMYQVSKKNRQLGVPKWGFMKGLRHLRAANKNLKHLEELDRSFQAT